MSKRMAHHNRASWPKAGEKPIDDPVAVADSFVSGVYEGVVRGTCVIFVGAGSTTERRGQGRPSFYDQIKKKSDYPPADRNGPSFPVLMQYFCDHIDGGRTTA